MHLRKAQPHEAEALWHLRNQAIRHGCHTCYAPEVIARWTPDVMPEKAREMIADNPFFVIEGEGVLAASGFLDLQNASVEAVFTLPTFGGKGLATQIINAIKHEARARGMTRLTLSATPNAATFYLRQGFVSLGESLYPSPLAGADLRCVDMEIAL